MRTAGCHSKLATLLAGLLVSVFALLGIPTHADDSPSLEYQIKASYIFNFAKFVEWPKPESETSEARPLNMCFLNSRNFGNALDKIDGQKLGDSTISIQKRDPASSNPTENCNLVFLGQGLAEQEEKLLAGIADAPVLTIGESSNFLESGGIFEFVRKRGKILFRISAKNAKAAKLRIDPQLLGLAIEVQ